MVSRLPLMLAGLLIASLGVLPLYFIFIHVAPVDLEGLDYWLETGSRIFLNLSHWWCSFGGALLVIAGIVAAVYGMLARN